MNQVGLSPALVLPDLNTNFRLASALPEFYLSDGGSEGQEPYNVEEERGRITECRYLDMCQNQIGDMGAECLCKFLIHFNCRVHILKLYKNNIGNYGLYWLGRLWQAQPFIKEG